jgi:hypothetical protein
MIPTKLTHTYHIFNHKLFKPFCHKTQHNAPFIFFYRVTLVRIVPWQSTFSQLTVPTLQSKNATCVTVASRCQAFPSITNVYVYSVARSKQRSRNSAKFRYKHLYMPHLSVNYTNIFTKNLIVYRAKNCNL